MNVLLTLLLNSIKLFFLVQRVPLNRPCTVDDICIDGNADCFGGYCVCRPTHFELNGECGKWFHQIPLKHKTYKLFLMKGLTYRTTEQLFCLQLKERRGKLNTPCLPSSTIGRGCTDSNTKCSAGNCVCRDGYYERNAACSKKLFQFFGKTRY